MAMSEGHIDKGPPGEGAEGVSSPSDRNPLRYNLGPEVIMDLSPTELKPGKAFKIPLLNRLLARFGGVKTDVDSHFILQERHKRVTQLLIENNPDFMMRNDNQIQR